MEESGKAISRGARMSLCCISPEASVKLTEMTLITVAPHCAILSALAEIRVMRLLLLMIYFSGFKLFSFVLRLTLYFSGSKNIGGMFSGLVLFLIG